MFLICAQEKQLTLINFSLSKIQCSRSHVVPFNVITIQLTSLQTASTHQLTIITLNRYLGQYYSCVAQQPRLLISLLFQQKFYSITKTCWKKQSQQHELNKDLREENIMLSKKVQGKPCKKATSFNLPLCTYASLQSA